MGWTQLMEVWSVLESRCAPRLVYISMVLMRLLEDESTSLSLSDPRPTVCITPPPFPSHSLRPLIPLEKGGAGLTSVTQQSGPSASRWHEDSFKLVNLGRPGSTSRPVRPRAEVGVCFINQFDQAAQKGRSWRSLLAAQLAALNVFKLKCWRCVSAANTNFSSKSVKLSKLFMCWLRIKPAASEHNSMYLLCQS